MIEGSIYDWVVPVARSAAGFVLGLLLGIFGGWTAVAFNAFAGYPWSVEVHRNIYLVSIGLGAGAGAYLAWINLTSQRSLTIAFILLVLAGGVAGAYLGFLYGQRAEPGFLGRHYAIDNAIHFGAAIGGIIVSTALGLLNQLTRLGR